MNMATTVLIIAVEYAACFAENMIALMFAADMTDTEERRIPLCTGVSVVLAVVVFMMNRTELFAFYTTIFGIISLTLVIHRIYKVNVTDSLIVTGAFMLILHMTDFVLISCIGVLSGHYDFGRYITDAYSYERCVYIIIAKVALAAVWIFLSRKTAAASVHQRKLGVGLFLAVGLIYSLEKSIYESFDPHVFASGILIFVVVGLVVYCCYQYGKLNEEQSRTYSNVFPSVSLSYPVGKVQLQLSYAADITRPDYSLLNSAPRYVNRYTYEAGNPLLQPTLSHNLGLDVAWKQLYFLAGYQHVKDGMTSYCDTYSEENPAISLVRPVNMEDYDKAYAMVAYSPKFGCWQPQWVASVERQWYRASTPDGSRMFNYPLGSFLWKNSLELPWGILMNVDATLITKGHSENVHIDKAQWRLDASLYKEFARKRLSCQFHVTDIFSSMSSLVTAYSGVRTLTMDTDTRRTFMLTLRYKFNVTKSKYKGTGAGSSQKSRM